MTDEERARILELLAREGQEQAPGILPESDGPPSFPQEEERMVDFTAELEKALRQVYEEDPPESDGPEEVEDPVQELWEVLRQTRQEAAALHREIQELGESLEEERTRLGLLCPDRKNQSLIFIKGDDKK